MAMAVTPEPVRTRPFTSDEVWRMVAMRLIGPDEPYELINGELRYVSPQDPPHAGVVRRLNRLLVTTYGDGWDVGVQLPIGGIADSIPEPDLAVTRARALDDPHPTAPETALVVEVVDTGWRSAREKIAIYAKAGCPEYWIVDIRGALVIVHRGPRDEGLWTTVDEVSDGEIQLPGSGGVLALAAFVPSRTTG